MKLTDPEIDAHLRMGGRVRRPFFTEDVYATLSFSETATITPAVYWFNYCDDTRAMLSISNKNANDWEIIPNEGEHKEMCDKCTGTKVPEPKPELPAARRYVTHEQNNMYALASVTSPGMFILGNKGGNVMTVKSREDLMDLKKCIDRLLKEDA